MSWSNERAVVVLSGGQDSTTALYWAKRYFNEIHAVTFDYGQRHSIEIDSAIKIATMAKVATHEVVRLPIGILKSTSPLTDPLAELEQYADHESLPGGLEKTFVPMRNQLFLTIAANRAYALGCNRIITGVAQEDFGGYPDCRRGFIDALEHASELGTFTDGFHILTPLMNLNKCDTVLLAAELDGCMDALAYSHTAYDGLYPPTGKDHASLLRAKGFEQAGYPDPLVVRAWREGLMDLPETANYDKVDL